jgi:hypothetical protein
VTSEAIISEFLADFEHGDVVLGDCKSRPKDESGSLRKTDLAMLSHESAERIRDGCLYSQE